MLSYSKKLHKTHRVRTVDKTFKMLPSLMNKIGIKFSKRHNAMYGMQDMVRFWVEMHKSGRCASGTSQALASNDDNGRVPTSAWVLGKMHEACSSVEDVQNVGKKMMRKTVHIARRNGFLKKRTTDSRS